ncbi:hypothetical protein QBC35DRAFT_394799 [Podospora australis]|uniref:Ankyrin n=1 Tax=Podospora australis TaxID=1536484 RepID=A0AAN7ADB8_9PEZI|nr:hypothetical protein QBC35DRAFT_394799 [Podospora australis]
MSGRTALSVASNRGHEQIVARLLKAGAKQVPSDGRLPIHEACCKGHFGTARELLKKYPDSINAEDEDGMTPLAHARKASMLLQNIEVFGSDDGSEVTDRGKLILHLLINGAREHST